MISKYKISILLVVIIVLFSAFTMSSPIAANNASFYKTFKDAHKNSKKTIEPDGKIGQYPEISLKANKNEDKIKFKKVEDIPEINDAEKIVKDSGRYIFKGTTTYEEYVNMLNEHGFINCLSHKIDPDRLVTVIIVKCDNTYTMEDRSKVKNALITWAYDSETGKRFFMGVHKADN